MSVNIKYNNNTVNVTNNTEKTLYGTVAPTGLTGNNEGDTYYVTSSGTSTGSISSVYRWDGTQWVKLPGGASTPLTPELAPVRDFKTTAELAALAAATTKPNDQTSYICTDGANQGKIATWDAVTGAFIYYTPTEGEITTMTNPSDPNNYGKFKYDAVSKTWVQVVIGLVLPEPAKRVKGGMNIAFPSRHIQSYRYTDTAGIGPIIQNDEVLAFGTNNYNYGDLTNNAGFPRKLPFSWSNLNGTGGYSPITTYVPKFVDLDACLNNLIALDSTGKPWVWSWSAYWHGLTSTPTATTTAATKPDKALYPVAFFQGRPDIIVSRVYSKSVNFDMVTDARSLACLDTLGRLWMTGSNGGGELGQGNTTQLLNWAQFGTLSNIVDIKMAQNGTFALTKTGQVYFAGMDSGRWMGGGANVVYNVPTLIPNCTNVKDFDFGNSANATFFMVVKNDGTVWGGGSNGNGQLGISTSAGGTQIGMVQVPGITNGKRIYCDRGGLCSCLLRTDGSISFAGSNRTGIFGYQGSTAATTPPIYTFVTPSGGMQGTVVDVLITENSTLALTVDGSVWRTGSGVHGGLGSTSGTTWALQNSWKRIPLPEPVLMMRGHTNQSTQDGVQFLTGIRGIIAYGASGTFRTNNVTISSTNSWRVLDDLRTWDTGIVVGDPIAQTI